MQKQAIIIGLGQFGMSVARALASRQVEVIAVDIREERVREAARFAAEAIAFDATDETALSRTSPQRRDMCLCAIGDESQEASIICTALLKQMGAERVIARANNELHARILRLVGAHKIINPEFEFGERFANQLLHDRIRGELSLGQGLFVTEFNAPSSFVGHNLKQLALPLNYGVTVVAMRHTGSDEISFPDPDAPLKNGDILVVVAKEKDLNKMMERI